MSNAVDRVADVVSFPARTATTTVRSVAEGSVRHLRDWTAEHVDDWGRDDAFASRVWSLSQLRWNVSVGGTEHMPRRAGALIVVNARKFAMAPVFAALAIGSEVGRPVRFVGRSDVAPFGPVLQRLGGMLPLEDELEGALRAGQLIVLGAHHEFSNQHCGVVDHRLVGAAVAAKVRVLPAATTSVPFRRSARVEIGHQVRLSKPRRGPLAELELADHVAEHVDDLLEEVGGILTGTPLDWVPFGGLGGL